MTHWFQGFSRDLISGIHWKTEINILISIISDSKASKLLSLTTAQIVTSSLISPFGEAQSLQSGFEKWPVTIFCVLHDDHSQRCPLSVTRNCPAANNTATGGLSPSREIRIGSIILAGAFCRLGERGSQTLPRERSATGACH
jgi:hypothetical protein